MRNANRASLTWLQQNHIFHQEHQKSTKLHQNLPLLRAIQSSALRTQQVWNTKKTPFVQQMQANLRVLRSTIPEAKQWWTLHIRENPSMCFRKCCWNVSKHPPSLCSNRLRAIEIHYCYWNNRASKILNEIGQGWLTRLQRRLHFVRLGLGKLQKEITQNLSER